MPDPLANLPAHLRGMTPACGTVTRVTAREIRLRDGYGALPGDDAKPCPATIFVDSDPYPAGRPTGAVPGTAEYGRMLRKLKSGKVGHGGGCPPMVGGGDFGRKRYWDSADGMFR